MAHPINQASTEIERVKEIRTPDDLFHLLSEVETLVQGDRIIQIAGTCPFAKIQRGKPWPSDVLSLAFLSLPKRRVYLLQCETYHGAGGTWEPMTKDTSATFLQSSDQRYRVELFPDETLKSYSVFDKGLCRAICEFRERTEWGQFRSGLAGEIYSQGMIEFIGPFAGSLPPKASSETFEAWIQRHMRGMFVEGQA